MLRIQNVKLRKKTCPIFHYILLTSTATQNTYHKTGKLKHCVGSMIFD